MAVLIVVAAMAVPIAVVCGATAPGNGVVLRFHQGKGDRATYRYSATAQAVAKGRAVRQAAMNLQMTCLAEFQGAASEGGAKIVGQILSGAAREKEKGREKTRPLGNLVANYRISPRGKIIRLDIVAGHPAEFAGLPNSFTPDEAFLLGDLMQLPERAVKPGDKWRTTLPAHSDSGERQHSVVVDSALLAIQTVRGRPCAKIRSTVTNTVQGAVTAGSGGQTGTARARVAVMAIWYFDYQRGLILSSDTEERAITTITSTAAGGGMSTATVTSTLEADSVLTEYNGEKLPAN